MKQKIPTLHAFPILVILGPTASGKSGLAVEIAKQFNGEIISADSRQIYSGLDIGTGKIAKEEMQGIQHHLIDVADPLIPVNDPLHYTVSRWKADAEKAIADIVSRGNLPIVCGGTGFYIDSLINNIDYPDAPVDQDLRTALEAMTTETLTDTLRTLDQKRAEQIDLKNRRRVIRSIEIAKALGEVPNVNNQPREDWNVLKIGITTPDEILKGKIHVRLVSHIDSGMIEEAEKLHADPQNGGIGLSYKRMHELGLEYRYIAEYLTGKISSRESLTTILTTKIWQYARRQKAWFKRDKSIVWMEVTTDEDRKKITERVRDFLSHTL